VTWGLTVKDSRREKYSLRRPSRGRRAPLFEIKSGVAGVGAPGRFAAEIIFFDEPYNGRLRFQFGFALEERVVSLLNESSPAVGGVKGVHCCGKLPTGAFFFGECRCAEFRYV